MTIHVFLGPTLRRAEAREILPDAKFLPPVSQGDVLRSAARRPTAIGIVDGRFHDVPAVWHKEIMWAICRGIPVYGSASMGALRAAELAPFGMRGVGEIFEAYHRGVLNDDDEVAVAHAGPEDGYRPVNEAMVNIRATLAGAVRGGVLPEGTAAELERLAKRRHYLGRGYPQLLLDGERAGLPADELAALRAWLPENRVNQKALDAREMLRIMAERDGHDWPPVTYTFEHTSYFEQSRQTAGEHSGAAASGPLEERDPAAVDVLEILDELRLDPPRYRAAWERAALRAVVDAAHPTPPDNLARAAARFRRDRGLTGTEETRAWLEANDLNVERFGALVGIEERVREAIEELGELMPLAVADLLRVDGAYGPLVRRVIAKRELLSANGLDRPAAADETTIARELRWYFDLIGEPAPESLENHWRPLGFTDQRDFLRAVRREYHYRALACQTEGREK